MNLKQLALAAGFVMAASSANASVVVFDFDGFADGTNLSGVDLGHAVLDGGIVNGGGVSAGADINGLFNMFGVINVTMDLTADDGSDVFINAFAPGNYLINSFSGAGGTVTLFAPNTVSVTFGSLNDAAISFDNLTLQTIAVQGGGEGSIDADVPVPAALPLMGAAFAGVAYLGYRRRG